MTQNIFVKDINNQTLTFQVDLKTQRVKDLLQKHSKKSGMKPQELQFVFAGKAFLGKQQSLLIEFGVQNFSTIYCVLRLKGGAKIKILISTVDNKSHELQIDDNKTGYQLKQTIYQKFCKSLEVQAMCIRYAGVEIQNDKKLSYYKIVSHKGVLKIIQQKCSIGKIAGIILAYQADPYGIDQQTVRMPCGHVIGRDGMTGFVRSLIDTHQFQIRCPAQKPNAENCDCEWEYALCRKVGVFTKQQIQQFQEGLSKNWINRQTSQCPNCQYRVYKGDLKSNRVICPKCKYGDYCYNCSKKWITNSMDFCGNPDCKHLNTLLSQCEWNLPFNLKINEDYKAYMLPRLRACPNPKCHYIISHDQGCKHMECKNCKTNFCWVCLSMKNGKWTCGGAYDYCGKVSQSQIF